MCLIVFAHQMHPDYPLLVAANRDEHYARPTRDAQWWPDQHDLVAGQDLEAGGTWLGVTRKGRFAAITNHRNPPTTPENPRSRGLLTLDFLRGEMSPRDYLQGLSENGGEYAGFNLLVGSDGELAYLSNIEGGVQMLQPGVYGLSNALLDTPWPKVNRAKQALQLALAEPPTTEQLQSTVARRQIEADTELPDTGVGLELERMLSPQFIVSDDYGTRAASSLLLANDGSIRFREERFGAGGVSIGSTEFDWP